MKMKELLEYARLKWKLQGRMVEIKETMDLTDASSVYAEYVCRMQHWPVDVLSGLSANFCEVSFAFSNGYIKALHDHGLEFRRGLVKKRDITNEMPMGALKYYREDAIADTKKKAVDALRSVMKQYETSQQNINVIVNAFEEKIKED